MTAGFDLALSTNQTAVQSYLHSVVQELRAAAADIEQDGIDAKALAQHLESAGAAPAALLEHGVDEPHTLLVALEELAYGDAATAWAAASVEPRSQ